MLATLTHERFSDPGWIFEWKLDGERCLAYRRDARTALYSRNRKPKHTTYPEIHAAVQALPWPRVVLDGEAVILTGPHRTSFQALQRRMQVRRPDAALLEQFPVTYVVFDVLHLEGWDLRAVPLRGRKRVLEALLPVAGTVRRLGYVRERGEAYFREACRRGWEGVVAKDFSSPYVSRRSRSWLKFKCVERQEFVIGGFTEPRGSRVGIGALLVGFYDRRGRLRYAGKVGTGFDTPTLLFLRRRLESLERRTPPFADDPDLPREAVHWVRPVLVAEVAFSEWTRAGKLRHPRFMGLRDDKDARDVTREAPAP